MIHGVESRTQIEQNEEARGARIDNHEVIDHLNSGSFCTVRRSNTRLKFLKVGWNPDETATERLPPFLPLEIS